MPDPDKTDSSDEIGEVSVEDIAAIIARFCPECSPEDIMRRVQEVMSAMPQSMRSD